MRNESIEELDFKLGALTNTVMKLNMEMKVLESKLNDEKMLFYKIIGDIKGFKSFEEVIQYINKIGKKNNKIKYD